MLIVTQNNKKKIFLIEIYDCKHNKKSFQRSAFKVAMEETIEEIININNYYTGADDQNRTGDLLITNQLLYRLSYIGIHPLIFRQGAQYLS